MNRDKKYTQTQDLHRTMVGDPTILKSVGLDGAVTSQRTNGFSSAIEKIQGFVKCLAPILTSVTMRFVNASPPPTTLRDVRRAFSKSEMKSVSHQNSHYSLAKNTNLNFPEILTIPQ